MLSGDSAKNRRYIAVHRIAEKLGKDNAPGYRGFHAFTGCDHVSFMKSKGKKTWLKLLSDFPDVMKAFLYISCVEESKDIPDWVFDLLEQFTIPAFVPAKRLQEMVGFSIDEVRQRLFDSEFQPQNLPPTRASLRQHILRAAYLAGQVWGRAAFGPGFPVPSPEGWGWVRNAQGKWEPLWSDLPWVWEACRELSSCNCKTGCKTMRCACRRGGLPCIGGCGCHDNCDNRE